MADDMDDEMLADEPDDFVRPFLVTAGRTRSSVEGVRIETMVQATTKGGDALRFEAARVFDLCETASAIAELSAHLSLPIGTVKVIVGDLIDSGHLTQHQTISGKGSGDIELISRLIDGVRRL